MTRAWLLCLGTPKAGSCVHAKSNSRESGFTLIEVMLIIAILGVLMSIAIAAYQDYSIRAKVSEGVALIAGVKEAVSESLVASGNFPTSNADAGMVAANTILGTYVSSVGTGATDGGGDGLILITYRGDPNIDTHTLEFSATTTAGSIIWTCGTSRGTGTSMPARYLPSSCRP
ncbi:MAG: pilin [Xanthomonadales bacterium]|nr:pilin [Xanthomonadales bacterium]